MSLNGRSRALSLPDSRKYSAKDYKDEDGYARLASATRSPFGDKVNDAFRTRNMREGKTKYYDNVEDIFLDNSDDDEHSERVRAIRGTASNASDRTGSRYGQQPGPVKVTDISARLAESARIAARHAGSLASMAWPELASVPPENGSRNTSPRGSVLRARNGSKTEAPPAIQPGGRLRDETWTVPLGPRSESPLAMNERFQDSFSSESRSYQSVSPFSTSSRKLHSPRSETYERSADKRASGAKAAPSLLDNHDWSPSNNSHNERVSAPKISLIPKLVSPRSSMFPLRSVRE